MKVRFHNAETCPLDNRVPYTSGQRLRNFVMRSCFSSESNRSA